MRFAERWSLLGVVCDATPLVQAPALITAVKDAGLMLVSCGEPNRDAALVALQERMGADAAILENGHLRVRAAENFEMFE